MQTVFVIQGNYGYGHGWEDLSEYEDRAEARADFRAYQANEPEYAHRLVTRRVRAEAAS